MLEFVWLILCDAITRPWLIITSFLLLIIYRWTVQTWSYFDKQKVKYVRGPPIVGATWRRNWGIEAWATSTANLYNSFPNEKIIGVYEHAGTPKYYIRDPELIKNVAIKDFDHFVNHHFFVDTDTDSLFGRSMFVMRDQRWKDMRSTLSPAFTGSKQRLMFSLIGEVSNNFVSFLRQDFRDGAECDIQELFTRFANDAIASCAFGIDINSLEDRQNQFYETGNSISDFTSASTMLRFLIIFSTPKFFSKWLNVQIFKQKDINYLRTIIRENMAYREKNGIVRNDMINILMEVKKGTLARDTVSNAPSADIGFATAEESAHDKAVYNGQKWSDDDLAAQCMIFFLAGFGTISATLSFIAHALTVNPDVQERLLAEINETKERLNGQPLSYEALTKMKYMDMVVSETMRMWSVVSISDRIVNKPYTMEIENGTKVQFEVGDVVVIPIHGLHRDPKYFPNPDTFDPERFSDENKANIVSGTYMPFGLGPRNCIASRFALMECKTCIYHLLSNFSLEMSEKTQHPLQFKKTGASLDSEKGFWLKMKLRN